MGTAPGWMLVLLWWHGWQSEGQVSPNLEWAGENVSSTVLSDPCMGYARHEALNLNLLQAVLINQGWEGRHANGKAVVARLACLPMTQLCPTGFIFIWVDKTHVRHRHAAFLSTSSLVVERKKLHIIVAGCPASGCQLTRLERCFLIGWTML